MQERLGFTLCVCFGFFTLFLAASSAVAKGKPTATKSVLNSEQKSLLDQIAAVHGYHAEAMEKLEKILLGSSVLGQGNPKASKHPVSSESCQQKIQPEKTYANAEFAKTCQAKYMAPTPGQDGAQVCVDQFEFPNIPCAYPVVWVRASEAQQICEAIGKRLCDAGEWEQACAGGGGNEPNKEMAETFSPAGTALGTAHAAQRQQRNKKRPQVWAYGNKQNHQLCATASKKSPGCDAALSSNKSSGKGVWDSCGSNTYPAGYFPECKSSYQVYDQHGNAAEHMNLALNPQQLTRSGGSGYTEMKGSWFIFQSISAHSDDCWWRAPSWHISELASPKSHANYHLGFRCCKDVKS